MNPDDPLTEELEATAAPASTDAASIDDGAPDLDDDASLAPAGPSLASRLLRGLLQLALSAGVIYLVAMYAGQLLEGNKPRKRRPPPPRNAALVSVEPAAAPTEGIIVHASGTVIPARMIELYARVQGEVVEVGPSLEPGAQIAQGDTVIKLDESDYRLELRKARVGLRQTLAQLEVEEGLRAAAKLEYDLIKGTLGGASDATQPDLSLLLREPQLDLAKATVDAARLAREGAAVEIARTHIVAPFDAFVISRSVAPGARVTTATPVAQIVATDAWWVEVIIPLDQLKYIDIPGPSETRRGSSVTLRHPAAWGPDVSREGRVLRLASQLDEQGQMARLLVEVPRPLDPALPRMYLNAWVEVEIEGASLEDVITLDRDHLREGDRVWVMTSERALDIRALEVVFRGPERVLVRGGLSVGEEVITSPLPAPVQGMTLRVKEETPPSAAPPPPGHAREGAPR